MSYSTPFPYTPLFRSHIRIVPNLPPHLSLGADHPFRTVFLRIPVDTGYQQLPFFHHVVHLNHGLSLLHPHVVNQRTPARHQVNRSEERRVGKAWTTRWSPYH